jgi:hypothetical protein
MATAANQVKSTRPPGGCLHRDWRKPNFLCRPGGKPAANHRPPPTGARGRLLGAAAAMLRLRRTLRAPASRPACAKRSAAGRRIPDASQRIWRTPHAPTMGPHHPPASGIRHQASAIRHPVSGIRHPSSPSSLLTSDSVGRRCVGAIHPAAPQRGPTARQRLECGCLLPISAGRTANLAVVGLPAGRQAATCRRLDSGSAHFPRVLPTVPLSSPDSAGLPAHSTRSAPHLALDPRAGFRSALPAGIRYPVSGIRHLASGIRYPLRPRAPAEDEVS